jgi:hypothetical protein
MTASDPVPGGGPAKGPTAAASRALAEAAARRASAPAGPDAPSEKETGGPAGPEPTRFGDWERKGRAVDF